MLPLRWRCRIVPGGQRVPVTGFGCIVPHSEEGLPSALPNTARKIRTHNLASGLPGRCAASGPTAPRSIRSLNSIVPIGGSHSHGRGSQIGNLRYCFLSEAAQFIATVMLCGGSGVAASAAGPEALTTNWALRKRLPSAETA